VRVLAFGIWSQGPEYPRPANLIGGLRDAGAEVTECRYAMAGDFSRRLRSVRGVAGPLGFALSLLAGVPVLAWRFLRAPRSDLILLQHPGIFHLHLARFLRLFAHRRAPIALDLFFSLHEALAADRRLLAPGSAAARALFLLERSACRGADLVLTDTRAHAEWAAGYFGLPAAKVLPIPVGPAFPPRPPRRTCPPTCPPKSRRWAGRRRKSRRWAGRRRKSRRWAGRRRKSRRWAGGRRKYRRWGGRRRKR
jgi:hypothetical protein